MSMLWYCGGHGVCLTNQGNPSAVERASVDWLNRWVKRDPSVRTGSAGRPHRPARRPLRRRRLPAADQRAAAGGRGAGRSRSSPPVDPARSPRHPGGPAATTPWPASPSPSCRPRRRRPWTSPSTAARTRPSCVGPPLLTLTYRGTASPGVRPTRVFAQLVDDSSGLVVGSQVTPIPVDARRRTAYHHRPARDHLPIGGTGPDPHPAAGGHDGRLCHAAARRLGRLHPHRRRPARGGALVRVGLDPVMRDGRATAPPVRPPEAGYRGPQGKRGALHAVGPTSLAAAVIGMLVGLTALPMSAPTPARRRLPSAPFIPVDSPSAPSVGGPAEPVRLCIQPHDRRLHRRRRHRIGDRLGGQPPGRRHLPRRNLPGAGRHQHELRLRHLQRQPHDVDGRRRLPSGADHHFQALGRRRLHHRVRRPAGPRRQRLRRRLQPGRGVATRPTTSSRPTPSRHRGLVPLNTAPDAVAAHGVGGPRLRGGRRPLRERLPLAHAAARWPRPAASPSTSPTCGVLERAAAPASPRSTSPTPLDDAYRSGFIYTQIARSGNDLNTGVNGYESEYSHDVIGILTNLFTRATSPMPTRCCSRPAT